MKKFVVFFLAGLLILAFGATVYAQAPKLEFRASGWIDTQTYISQNVPPYTPVQGMYNALVPNMGGFNAAAFAAGGPGFQPVFDSRGEPIDPLNKTSAMWDSRMHLKFDAVMGKELSGTLYFEIDAFRWGNNPGIHINNTGGWGSWATDHGSVEVKNLYIDFGLPYFGIPVPVTARIGAQPLGIRPNVLVYTDGTGLTGGIKLDPVMISPMYFKALEGLDWNSDDVDVYGLNANVKVSTFTIGGYGLYYNMDTYPFTVGSAAYNAAIPTGTQKAKMWWWGAYADGKLGPIDLNFDFIYDYGRVLSTLSPVDIAPDVKYRGWLTRLKINYPWEKFNFGVTGLYASGSNADRTHPSGLPGSITQAGVPSDKVSGFVVPVGSESGPANGESAVFYGMEAGAMGGISNSMGANYNTLSKGPFGGSWFAKVFGSYSVTPSYKVTLQYLYIGDTTKNGNTMGTAWDFQRGTLRNDSTIGHELNLINEWQIYRNLTFKFWGGYMWAGDAMDIFNPVTGSNFSMHNPWAVRTRLMYTF